MDFNRLKRNLIKHLNLSGCIILVTSCVHHGGKVENPNESVVKYGTVVQIGRIKNERQQKLAHTGKKIGEAGYQMGTLFDDPSGQGGAGGYASGLALGSLVYYGGEAFGGRDSLEIEVRLDDGSSRRITQKVRVFEHFGIGDRVKILNGSNVTH